MEGNPDVRLELQRVGGKRAKKKAGKQATWLKQLCRLDEDKVNKVVSLLPATAGACSNGSGVRGTRAARAGPAERPQLPSWKPLPALLALLK